MRLGVKSNGRKDGTELFDLETGEKLEKPLLIHWTFDASHTPSVSIMAEWEGRRISMRGENVEAEVESQASQDDVIGPGEEGDGN